MSSPCRASPSNYSSYSSHSFNTRNDDCIWPRRRHQPRYREGGNLAGLCKDAYLENQYLKEENSRLKNNIKCVRQTAAGECTKILNAVVDFCECRCELARLCKPKMKVASKRSRMGRGCSSQGCGGYTPSGWNKVLNKQRLDNDDPCCIPPPCSCPCPCPRCCTCVPRPSCPVVCCLKTNRSRNKCGRNKSNSRATSPSGESGSDRAERAEEADKHRPSSKILGELAFQLERRILDYVFGAEDSKSRRFYGYTVNNICSMVNKESKVSGGDDGVIKKGEMSNRLNKLLQALKKHSYKIKVHGDFAQKMINKYGLLQSPPDTCTVDSFGLNDANTIAGLISELACGPYEAQNFNILLKSLQYMSKCDGRPLFVW